MPPIVNIPEGELPLVCDCATADRTANDDSAHVTTKLATGEIQTVCTICDRFRKYPPTIN